VLHVFVEGPVSEKTGFVMDYADISAAVKPLIERLDHRHLGQWIDVERQNSIPTNPAFTLGCGTGHMVDGLPPEFYPSSENLLWWIGKQLRPQLEWSKLALEETCTSYCELTREEYMVGMGQATYPGILGRELIRTV
jgi:6-pyruvoyltetrahydropterin/6-carboxytetrahydropterin synthase